MGDVVEAAAMDDRVEVNWECYFVLVLVRLDFRSFTKIILFDLKIFIEMR